MKAPFFVSTQYVTFDEYLEKLNRESRRKFLKGEERYQNVKYLEISYDAAMTVKPKMEEIWSNQIVEGSKLNGKVCLPCKENTHYFVCVKDNECIMLHIVEYFNNYIYCHMPMYDKNLYSELGRYSWFMLIKYTIENTKQMLGIDMGGVCGRKYPHNCRCNCNPHFRYIVENRKNLTKYEYKFTFLTRDEKDPQKAKKLVIVNNYVVELS